MKKKPSNKDLEDGLRAVLAELAEHLNEDTLHGPNANIDGWVRRTVFQQAAALIKFPWPDAEDRIHSTVALAQKVARLPADTEEIFVIVKAPDKPPELRMVTNTLEGFQYHVKGSIEHCRLGPSLHFYCNEDGKRYDLPFNFGFHNDAILGTVVFCAFDEGGNDTSLSPDQLVEVFRFLEEVS